MSTTECQSPQLCGDCKMGTMVRDWVCNEMVLWSCTTDGCPRMEYENFADMDDEGWEWLRNYCTEEKP
jgi:hypothetical protein